MRVPHDGAVLVIRVALVTPSEKCAISKGIEIVSAPPEIVRPGKQNNWEVPWERFSYFVDGFIIIMVEELMKILVIRVCS